MAAVTAERRPAGRAMVGKRSGNGVARWEIHAHDASRISQFYADLFAWQLDPVNDGAWGMVDARQQVGIASAVSLRQGPSQMFCYVEVDDLHASLATAERLGGRTVVPPWQVDVATRLAVFTDPEGNRVGLLERRG